MIRHIVPDVSLISSWCVPHQGAGNQRGLDGLRIALEHGIGMHDLYFLDRADIDWYAKHSGAEPNNDPLAFVSSLEPKHLDDIAEALKKFISQTYRGSLIGPRPQVLALATYWPFISSVPFDEPKPDADKSTERRRQSIKAVQASLYLAAKMGCRCVEIVGGAAIPEERSNHDRPADWRKKVMNQLAESLDEIYDKGSPLRKALDSEFPIAAVEIEPGASFLINDVSAFELLVRQLDRSGHEAARRVMLNVDVAHCFLLEATHGSAIFEQVKALKARIAHFHCSDHARTHAADLIPGTYHFLQDYRPWLELAIELATERGHKCAPNFSGAIAVELEACNDIHEAARGIGRLQRWLRNLVGKLDRSHREKTPGAQVDEAQASGQQIELCSGAVLVVDLGNSTKEFFGGSDAATTACGRIEKAIGSICKTVQRHCGSAYSYTGDGVIAFFNEDDFVSGDIAAKACVNAARGIVETTNAGAADGVTIRVALHWGVVYIPSYGPLGNQIIGRDVVVASRLCDWLGKTIEPAISEQERDFLIGWTGAFEHELSDPSLGKLWGTVEFKGLTTQPNARGPKFPQKIPVYRCDAKKLRRAQL
jgi:sugar phosphate isomerase/epimerase